MSKRISRRILLTSTGSALTVALLAACGGDQRGQAPVATAVTTAADPAAALVTPVPTTAAAAEENLHVTVQPASQTDNANRPFDREPYLQDLSSTSVIINWQLRKSAASWLRIGTPGGDMRRIDSEKDKTLHVTVDSLQPNTTYEYEIGVGSTVLTPRYSFRSAPGSDATDFSFVVFGDSGEGTDIQKQLAARMVALKPDIAIHTGDVVYGTPAHFEQLYFNVYAEMLTSTAVFPAIGDNDAQAQNGKEFMKAFVLPQNAPAIGNTRAYSFDYGPAHFVALDTESDFDDHSPQYRWLVQDLARTQQKWKFVYFHRPAYSAGEDREHDHIQKTWAPVFEKYGVSMAFSGHDHNYQRTIPIHDFSSGPNGVVYVISGGGGAELREVTKNEFTAFTQAIHHVVKVEVHGETATIRAYKADGSVIDEATIQRNSAV